MKSVKTSHGVCPICESNVLVSNPIWIERRASDATATMDGRLIERRPLHERCYAAWSLGLAEWKEG